MKNLKPLIVIVLTLSLNVVYSAPAPPPSGTTGGATTTGGSVGSPDCWPPPCVPIDNGIIFLVAAGVLYSAKKFFDYQKRTQISS